MKVYIIDKNVVHRDEKDNLIWRDVFSIIHYESSDDNGQTEIQPELVQWSKEKVLLELAQGDGAISGIPSVQLVKDRHFSDGRIERVETLSLDVTALYELYLHLKKIDEENPDNLMW